MKAVAIIEARMASTRLPGKTLSPIMGRPMLELLIERLACSRLVHQIVVATTDRPEDFAIEQITERLKVGCFRGSSEDVLSRVLQAAQRFDTDLIVEITGDCPLIDSVIVDQVIQKAVETGCDYVGNYPYRTYPRGLEVRAFPTKILSEVATLTNEPADREHVSLYIYEHPERYKIMYIESGLPERWREARLTVDTKEDLEVVKIIFENLYPQNPTFGLADIIGLLERMPDILHINRQIKDKQVR